MTDTMSFDVHLSTTYEDALAAVKQALQGEGFGVLTQIDVQAAFKEKIGEDFRPYAILGACNPKLAHRALSLASDIGLMLPCNVTVEQDPEAPDSGVIVRIIDPVAMMQGASKGDHQEMAAVASEAREKLQRVAQALAAL